MRFWLVVNGFFVEQKKAGDSPPAGYLIRLSRRLHATVLIMLQAVLIHWEEKNKAWLCSLNY